MASKITNDLNTLSLENNNIYLTSGLIWIRRNFPDLKTLNLSGNQVNKCYLVSKLKLYIKGVSACRPCSDKKLSKDTK